MYSSGIYNMRQWMDDIQFVHYTPILQKLHIFISSQSCMSPLSIFSTTAEVPQLQKREKWLVKKRNSVPQRWGGTITQRELNINTFRIQHPYLSPNTPVHPRLTHSDDRTFQGSEQGLVAVRFAAQKMLHRVLRNQKNELLIGTYKSIWYFGVLLDI